MNYEMKISRGSPRSRDHVARLALQTKSPQLLKRLNKREERNIGVPVVCYPLLVIFGANFHQFPSTEAKTQE